MLPPSEEADGEGADKADNGLTVSGLLIGLSPPLTLPDLRDDGELWGAAVAAKVVAGIRTEGLLIDDEGEESGKRLGEGEVGVGGKAATKCGGSPAAAVKAWVVAASEENGLGRLEIPGGNRPAVPGNPKIRKRS